MAERYTENEDDEVTFVTVTAARGISVTLAAGSVASVNHMVTEHSGVLKSKLAVRAPPPAVDAEHTF